MVTELTYRVHKVLDYYHVLYEFYKQIVNAYMGGKILASKECVSDNSILILGAGTFASEVEELCRLIGYKDIAFLDDNPSTAYCKPVIGKMSEAGQFKGRYKIAIVALGNNEDRKKYTTLLGIEGFVIPALIHPTAFISADAKIGEGCIIRTNAVVSRYAELKIGVIVNVGALIDHHCIIGAFSHIQMGSVIRNKAFVEPLSWVESNVVVQ